MNERGQEKNPEETELTGYERFLETEINLTLEKGGLLAGTLGIAGGAVLWILGLLEVLPYYQIPAIWGTCCGFYGFFVSLMARHRLIIGATKYWVFFPLISLPTMVYLISHLFLPSGTATYITGVPSYLYIFVVIMTGFLFDKKISIFSGIIVGVEYFAMFLVGRQHLLQITMKDDILFQDLTGYPMYILKSAIMVFAGLMMGILSENVKKLMTSILKEGKEKHRIDKLFGQFVSNEIKDKIVAAKKDLIAENKTVAVLFADIRDFSAYGESTPPAVVVNQLNQYFDKMVCCITRYGGTVDKFIGDAIMAVFGGLLELENPCENAIRAALMMKEELDELNREWVKSEYPAFKNGIGISFGEVTQGTLGSKERKEFTVIGDTVNSASRLESLTKDFPDFGIILSRSVYEELPVALREKAKYLARANVKGKHIPIMIYGMV